MVPCPCLIRLGQQIAELEVLAAERGADKRNTGMASVNRKNAARNFENAFKNVGARPEGAQLAADGVDPFSRRKTRPMNYWATKARGSDDATNGVHCGLIHFDVSHCAVLYGAHDLRMHGHSVAPLTVLSHVVIIMVSCFSK